MYEWNFTGFRNSGQPDPVTHESSAVAKTTTRLRVWVDSQTDMPLRQTVSTDGEQQARYWSYDPNRIDAATLPPDFFKVAEPSAYDMDASVEYRGARSSETTTDTQTGDSFRPYFLGDSLTAANGLLCLDTTALFKHSEPDPGDDVGPDPEATRRDLSKLTRIDAVYGLAVGPDCAVGAPDVDQGGLLVSSFAKDSQFAAAYRDEIVDSSQAISIQPAAPDPDAGLVAYVVGTQPLIAYILPSADGSSVAVTEIGHTTIVVTGDFSRTTAPTILKHLETH